MNRGSLIVDTNLLLLFLVGTARIDLIATHDRLRSDFDADDFNLLCSLMAGFDGLVFSSPIIVEIDYFAGKTRGSDRYLVLSRLRQFVGGADEVSTTCERGINSKEFARLGLSTVRSSKSWPKPTMSAPTYRWFRTICRWSTLPAREA